VLALALFHKKDKAGGDTYLTRQNTKHLQPSLQPMAKMLQMQTVKKFIDMGNHCWHRSAKPPRR